MDLLASGMAMKRIFLWLGLILAPLGASAQALPFDTTTAELQRVPRELVLDGRLEAVSRSTVSAQVSGRVLEILFDVDDYVTKGEVILRFRDTEQQAALKQAEASLGEAEARANEAGQEFERIRKVYEKKLVSKAAMDKASADLEAARARLEAAEGAVSVAREQLENTVVRAPYDGIVVERHVELGELANPGQPLMTGLSLELLRAVVDVPQRYVASVREHRKARILVPGADEAIAASELTAFPFAQERSHTFRIRVDFPSGQTGLYPGMFAKVAFHIGEQERLLVPADALVYRSEVTGVYVVDADGRVSLRQVRLGGRHPGERVEVVAGLVAGERIALEPIAAGVYLKTRTGE